MDREQEDKGVGARQENNCAWVCVGGGVRSRSNTVTSGIMFLKGPAKFIDEKEKIIIKIAQGSHIMMYFDAYLISLCIIYF